MKLHKHIATDRGLYFRINHAYHPAQIFSLK